MFFFDPAFHPLIFPKTETVSVRRICSVDSVDVGTPDPQVADGAKQSTAQHKKANSQG